MISYIDEENGAIAQEAEAEGFAIEKLQQPTVMAKIASFMGLQQQFDKKLENAFDLAFRPERSNAKPRSDGTLRML